jgi:hypothetical protein
VRSRIGTIRTFGRDSPVTVHWLVHSTGFRVRRGLRRGVVERVVIDPETGLAAHLVVRYRLRPFRRRVGPEKVEAVVPGKRVLVVAPPRRGRRGARALGRGARSGGLAVAVAGGVAARRGRVGLGAMGRGAGTAARATGRGATTSARAAAAATVTTGRASGRATAASGSALGRGAVVAGLGTAALARRAVPVVATTGSAAARTSRAFGGRADRGLLLFARRAYVLALPLAMAGDRWAAELVRAARRVPIPRLSMPSTSAVLRRLALPESLRPGLGRRRDEEDPSGLRVVGLVEDADGPVAKREEVRPPSRGRPVRSQARGRR